MRSARCRSWSPPVSAFAGFRFPPGLYVPPLRDLLSTQPLPARDLLIVCALSSLGYAAVRLDRVLHPAKTGRIGPSGPDSS